MIGDFNIRDNIWDFGFPHHSQHSSVLFDITDSFCLELSRPTEQISTRYSNNQQDSNLVINLMFLRQESLEHNNHTIHPDLRLTSNHASLTVDISIFEENIQTKRYTLVKNSKEENKFINELIETIREMNTENICNENVLDQIVQEFASTMERLWYKHSKIVNITKHSKRSGEMNNVKEILNTFDNQDILMTGKISEISSRRQSMISSIQKFKKLQMRVASLVNSWIRLRNANSQLLKQSNLIEDLALKLMTYGRCHKLHSACIFTTSRPIFTN